MPGYLNKGFTQLAYGGAFLLYWSGILGWYARRKKSPVVAILTYHQIKGNLFEEHIKFLKKRYNIISLDYLAELLSSGKSIPSGSVAITFDDGYKSVFEEVFPLLKRHKVPATFYLVSEMVGTEEEFWWETANRLAKLAHKKGLSLPWGEDLEDSLGGMSSAQRREALQSWGDRLGYKAGDRQALSWEEVEEIAASKLVSIGSHTKTHPWLARLDKEEARGEIIGSKLALESRLHKPIRHFAFPGGSFNQEIAELVREAGYLTAVTVVPGVSTALDSPYQLKRIGIGPRSPVPVLAVKVCGLWYKLFRKLPFRLQRKFYGKEFYGES